MKINLLEPSVFNRISAGEVVERPASIVKELVENSIDAGAKHIRIEIEQGGKKCITVADDGCGIDKEDLPLAFLPHATSKIKNVDDLENIVSLGFRGEALASIASVCQVRLSSKTEQASIGYMIKVEGGTASDITQVARENGTTISCANLFYNTPARAKFLRRDKLEESEITHIVQKIMLSHSDICFTYYVDGKEIYNTTSCSMQDIIYTIYGREVYENLIEVDFEENGYKIGGFITKPKISKSNRTYQTLFINGRWIENYLISQAVQGVYESFLMKGRFPIYILSITLPADCVDVNVHPSKREVKFENPNKIFSIVRKAVEKALLSVDQIADFKTLHFDIDKDGQKQEIDFKSEFNMEGSNPAYKKSNEPISPTEGKSFSIDLFDRDAPIFKPKEFDVEVKKVETEDNNSQENSDEVDFSDLKNLTIKDKYILSSKDDSTIFFDQSGEKFTHEIENNTKKFFDSSIQDEMKILGTVFKTYIVIELEDKLYFIDQHAGHERLLYDRLVKIVDGNNNASQSLLAPYTFNVGIKEASFIDEILPQLRELGFDIEKEGCSFTIKSLPYILSYIELDKFVDELVKESAGLYKKASDFIHDKLCQTACKHAIKAGDQITKEECAYLIENVRKGVMLCPHGRPIALVLTKKDFEKMFKRIV